MNHTSVKRKTLWESFQLSLFSSKVTRVITYVFLSIWSATTVFPLIWVINNSFKTSNEITMNSFSIATSPVLDNYINAFSLVNIGKSYLNSVIMAGGTVIGTLIIGGVAAFILARFEFKIRSLIQGLLIVSLLIPNFVTVVPVFEIMTKLDLINTYWAFIFPHIAGNLPFSILVMTGFMATIPTELEEASIMDGCSRMKMYIKVFIPISKPALAAVGIFVFLWSYNDLFSALIFVNNEKVRPIVVLLSEISSQYGTDYGLMASAVTLTAIPVIIVYLFLQKYIEDGLTAGAVKG